MLRNVSQYKPKWGLSLWSVYVGWKHFQQKRSKAFMSGSRVQDDQVDQWWTNEWMDGFDR